MIRYVYSMIMYVFFFDMQNYARIHLLIIYIIY